MQDVWVRAQSIISGSRAVRADTIVQVRWDRNASQYVTLAIAGGEEVHRQARPIGSRAQPLTEKDGTALADELLSAMVSTAALPGSHLLVLHEVGDIAPNGTGLQWCRNAMDNASKDSAS
ncbi:hypothetical protein ACIO6T_44185 [Streptomyces sp. NPDC087532]|uniref:hypothetical protein n=1 Tax=unclassified Streptomyces TaxID=2593676 RepID=UPI00331BE3B9